MAIEIGLIFTALGAAKSVAEFVGILDSIEAKIDRLVQSELNAGLRALEQAARATAEQVPLLREARGCFNRAVSLEMGYRQVVALLGLSLCHHRLDDKPNSTKALEEILEINPVTTLKLAIAVGMDYFENPGALLPWILWLFRNRLIKYGPLIFSSRTRKEYYRKLVLDAVGISGEAMAIRDIQESVSMYVGKPVSWLKALE